MAVDNIEFDKTYLSDENITTEVLPSTDYGMFALSSLNWQKVSWFSQFSLCKKLVIFPVNKLFPKITKVFFQALKAENRYKRPKIDVKEDTK